jgi:N-acetylglucosaminyl-diphospho-decaprenol L-rhamnosyltransferase
LALSRAIVVIVHFGELAPTIELANHAADFDAEIVVVANDLKDRPIELNSTVEWLVPARNLGYGDAFNAAIVDRKAAAYVLLNTDLVMPRRTFDRCLEVLSEGGVGVVGPVLRREDGSLQSGAARLTRWRRVPQVLFDPGARVVECSWVTGAAMFIKGEVALDVGMDGSYFLGAEDADLCIRAGRAGWRILCCGDVSARHQGGQVIAGPRWSYYTTRNRVWWTRANFGIRPAVLNWLSGLFMLPRVVVADILRRRDLTSSRLIVLALRHAWHRKPSRLDGARADEPLAGQIMNW